ncbi:ABC transporter ATP-binding protein, partial [Rhizobiaceae sp. 2RAB30]
MAFTLGLVLRLNALLIRLMSQLNSILRTLGLLENAQELVARPLTVTDRPEAAALDVPAGEIRLENVGFAYRKDMPVL